MSETTGLIIIGIGVLFDTFGLIGLIRFPDVYNRLQAATKCVTLGTGFILFGFFIYTGFTPAGIKALICLLFILITSPTSAHALARASHKYGIKLWEKSVCDLYAEKEMVTASAVMNKNVTTVLPDITLQEAMNLIIEKDITGLPVVDTEENLIGIITEKDIIDYKTKANLKFAKVRDAMKTDITTYSPETPLEEIIRIISEERFRRVPIVENKKVVGIISRRDIIKFLKDEEKEK